MNKIKVYVYNPKNMSLIEYADMESARHPCSRATDKQIYSETRNLPTALWNGILSEEERKIVNLAKECSEEHGLEFETVNLATCSTIEKLKFLAKGVKAPAIVFKNKIIQGIPTNEELESLVQE